MPKLTILTGRSLYSPNGARLGGVEHVLFHPHAPVVVGFEVQPARLWGVIARKTRFVPREMVAISEGMLVFTAKRLPAASAGEKERGFGWDQTVIWLGMGVSTPSGERLGVVADADVSLKTGALRSVTVSGGATADVALGRMTVPGDAVIGFDGERIEVRELPDDVGYSGGAAKVAGTGAAVAKAHAERLVRKAGTYGKAAAEAVTGPDAAKRAGAAAAGAWLSVRKAVRDAGKDDEDE